MSEVDHCPFCDLDNTRIILSGDLVCGLWDAFPVSPGHILVVPRRHAAGWEDLAEEEKADVWRYVDLAIAHVRSHHAPDGFNVGFNRGVAAGQTIFHFHLHVIPRYAGDVPDPRGGVRHVIPAKANYIAQPLVPDKAQKLVKGGEDPLLPHLITHMDQADTCDIAVAFLLDSGARLIKEHLQDFLSRGGAARILVGDYLDVTEPIALRRLADLKGNFILKVFETQGIGFHLKSYIFLTEQTGVAFVGSSNLSASALTTSIEWNYKILSSAEAHGFKEVRVGFDTLFGSKAAVHATADWIDVYEDRRRLPDPKLSGIPVESPLPPPLPNAIQQEALVALEQTREEGFTAALVVLATGLGKTWLAAFDSQRFEFRRVLFVCHREEILDQAVKVFRRVRPSGHIGRFANVQRDIDAELVFASVQTLGRTSNLARFGPNDFDYVVIDEFHHAAASQYRRIIDYFQPKFLLGLTATPDRTDGADLLGFCQENLPFQASIRDGIESNLLCPFRYFGVPDNVDYTNIPWRSAQFDIAELTAAVATEARAGNSLEQLRKLGGKHCIAFCCSQRHADYMAEYFVSNGVRAVAVHSGANSAPRTTSLQRLQDGDLEVIFAVDMFNEGVDVPAIDTILMLRPTESVIVWLQQLGRGLRTAVGKSQLTVIDYIGNHCVFLTKLQAMALAIDWDANTSGQQRELLKAIIENRTSLPPGCTVTYDLAAIDVLKALLRPARSEEQLEIFYREFEYRHGVRPTAIEVFHAGLNPRSNSEQSWLGFIGRMGGLSAAEMASWTAHREMLISLEKTPMSRSYKIALLFAMMEGDTLEPSLEINELVRRVATLAKRIHRLAEDFSVDLSSRADVARLMINNPIKAFVDGDGTGGVQYFTFDGQVFAFAAAIEDRPTLAVLLREILDWRLAQYLARSGADARPDLICRVARNGSGSPILFLPANIGGARPPEGPLEVDVSGRRMVAQIAKIAINVVRDPDGTRNELSSILRGWFGDDVGLPGRGDRVRLRRSATPALLEPIGTSANSTPGLKMWERYARDAIPRAFGSEFNKAIWNAGFVITEPHIFLLVTLAKEGMNPDHQYADHFISAGEFSWQSQNRTTQNSKHGSLIRDHHKLSYHVHLLVRPTKRIGAVVTPFVYCGEVDFLSWEGDGPITVLWRLREPVPRALWSALQVPD